MTLSGGRHALRPRKVYFNEFYGRAEGFWLLAFYEISRTKFYELQSLLRCQIKAEIKGFLLMYRVLKYKHWFPPNFELKHFPDSPFTPCTFNFQQILDFQFMVFLFYFISFILLFKLFLFFFCYSFLFLSFACH